MEYAALPVKWLLVTSPASRASLFWPMLRYNFHPETDDSLLSHNLLSARYQSNSTLWSRVYTILLAIIRKIKVVNNTLGRHIDKPTYSMQYDLQLSSWIVHLCSTQQKDTLPVMFLSRPSIDAQCEFPPVSPYKYICKRAHVHSFFLVPVLTAHSQIFPR